MPDAMHEQAAELAPRDSYVIARHAIDDRNLDVEAERQLGVLERLWNSDAFRKSLIIVVLAALWEWYARHLNNPLLLPSLSDTLGAGEQVLRDGTLLMRTWSSLKILLLGYSIGIALAANLGMGLLFWRR